MTDGPAGTASVEAPALQCDAVAMREAYRTFWCTTQAGGCGAQLRMIAGDVRVPHFRHRASSRSCVFGHGDRVTGPAYAHLAYQRAIAAWLADQGYTAHIEHTFADGDGRADLHVIVQGVAHSIEVQLSDISEDLWHARTVRYSRHVARVTWLHGPTCNRTLEADRLTGRYALTIKNADGAIRVGTYWGDAVVWAELSECTMTTSGVQTPHIATALQALAEAERLADAEAHARAEADRLANDELRAQAVNRERRRVEQQRSRRHTEEEAAARRASELAREQSLRRREEPPGGRVFLFPSPGDRTFAQWEGLHPEMSTWATTQDWGWLAGFTPLEQRAGKWMAYVVQRLYARASLSYLNHPELTLAQITALTHALHRAGLMTLTPPDQRWRRAEL